MVGIWVAGLGVGDKARANDPGKALDRDRGSSPPAKRGYAGLGASFAYDDLGCSTETSERCNKASRFDLRFLGARA